MARKTLEQKIDSTLDKIKELQKEHEKLVAEHSAKEERERTHRLCKRGGYIEKYLPEMKTLTDNQFYTYFEKVMQTDESRLILMELAAENAPPAEPKDGNTDPQDGGTAAPKPTEAAAQTDTPPAPKPAHTPNNGGTGGNGNGGNHNRQNNQHHAQKPNHTPHNGNGGGNHNGGNGAQPTS